MGNKLTKFIKILFTITMTTLSPYCFSSDSVINTSYFENYFFRTEQNNHYFAFSKNQYFVISREGLKIWIWNPIKNSFCKPIEIYFINNESYTIIGSEKSDVSYSYYSGNNPDEWIIDGYAYNKLCIPNIYKGIDLEFYFKNHELEFDFVIGPKADLNQIVWEIRGNSDSFIDKNELVIINNEGYTYTFSIPDVYQSTSKRSDTILDKQTCFLNLDKNTYRIFVDNYDRNKELIIDPILTLSTYIIFPSTNKPDSSFAKTCMDYYNNGVADIAVIGGTIELAGVEDVDISGFLCKISPNLGRTYYIAFINGIGEDYVNTINHYITSTNEYIVIGGKTNSLNFPILNSVQPLDNLLNLDGIPGEFDGFLMIFDKDFRIIFSTFVGGAGYDSIEDITINNNNLIFAGNTNSLDIPLVNSSINTKEILADVFWGILRLTNPLEYLYITKLNIDGIEIKDIESYSRSVYLCGNTTVGVPYFNSLIPETNVKGKDIFIQTYTYTETPTTPDISLSTSLFFGGSNDDILEGCTLLYNTTLCLAGNTYSNDIPGPVLSSIPDTIIDKTVPYLSLFNTVANRLIGTHYIFGDGTDVITDIKTPNISSNTFFISGYTNSSFKSFSWDSLSFTSNPFHTLLNNGLTNEYYDAMIWRLKWNSIENTITPTWGTLLGGVMSDIALSIGTVSNNHICFSGITNSPDFPLQGSHSIAPAYLPSHYVSAFNILGKVIYVNPDSPTTTPDGSSWGKGFHTISEAITSANDYDEIWIKAGEYYETLTISELSNVTLWGGFLGYESNIDDRNPWDNPTKVLPVQSKGVGDLSTPLLDITSSMNIKINGLIFENGNNIIGNGGAVRISNSIVSIASSQFYKNKSYIEGGAIYINNSYANLTNCVFVQNACHLGNGSAVSANESTLQIIHCTFADNYSSYGSEISSVNIQGLTSMLLILNSIIWAKSGNNEVQIKYPETITSEYLNLSNSIIQNFSKLSSPPLSHSILDTEPLFVNYPSENSTGDLNLVLDSPAVDFGDPISLTIDYGGINEDIRRRPRVLMGESCKPDAGAFEIFPAPPLKIILSGDNPLYLRINEPFIEPGYEAIDGCNVDITFLVDVVSNVNSEQLGTYTVEYSVINPYDPGKVTKVTRTVIVIPGTPQIILYGPSDVVIECRESFIDPGVIAFDSAGNDITNEITVVDNVDYLTPGTYTIEYHLAETETHPSLSTVRNITIQDTTPPVLILIGPPKITIPCGSTWNDPGYITFDKCTPTNISVNVTGTVITSLTGTYTINYIVFDGNGLSTSLTRTVIVNCSIPQPQQCENQCSNDTTPIDEDGDGLSLCIETCLGTSDQNTDTDNDGMADFFETLYNLNPLSKDAKEDADLDGLLNIEEFLAKTNPKDSDSPWESHYVSTIGGNDNNPGTLSAPRATITNALSNLNIISNNSQSIVLFPGDYYEDIVLPQNTILIGITAYGGNNRSVVYGNIIGAEGAKIYNIDIKSHMNSTIINPGKISAEKPILLNCGDTTMHIKNVHFLGTGSEIGISVEGGHPYNTIIENCLFQDLSIGILIGDSIPVIRKCIFLYTHSLKNDSATGIYIEDNSGSTNPSNSLGDVNDPNTGWNTFDTKVGKAILSERPDEIKAHNNDWGTEDTDEISSMVQGNLDTQYFLGKGKAIIASSLVCVIWNASNRVPIRNATITINPAVYPPLTQNTDGVYTFPSIPDGTYTVRVSAPNFETKQFNTKVPEGDLKSESIALKPITTLEGEGTTEGSIEGTAEGTTEGDIEGEDNIVIPDIRGKSKEEAIQILTSAGLRVSATVKEEYSKEIPKGKVIRTEPSIGTAVPRDSEVVLVLSKGSKRRFIISCGVNNNYTSYSGDIIMLLLISTILIYQNRKQKYIPFQRYTNN